MIQYCGIGVAMGNGIEELKKVANIVSPSIEDQGLETVLKALF